MMEFGDNGLKELAYYVRNALRGPAARIERVLLGRLPRLKGDTDDDEVDLSTSARRVRARRELRATAVRRASPEHIVHLRG